MKQWICWFNDYDGLMVIDGYIDGYQWGYNQWSFTQWLEWFESMAI